MSTRPKPVAKLNSAKVYAAYLVDTPRDVDEAVAFFKLVQADIAHLNAELYADKTIVPIDDYAQMDWRRRARLAKTALKSRVVELQAYLRSRQSGEGTLALLDRLFEMTNAIVQSAEDAGVTKDALLTSERQAVLVACQELLYATRHTRVGTEDAGAMQQQQAGMGNNGETGRTS